MIKKVSYHEFRKIYREHIVKDFPANERIPFYKYLIKYLYKKGMYSVWVMCENDKLCGYACLIHVDGVEGALLDYYAVVPELRDKGYGSKFMRELKENLEWGGILIEAEMPNKAKTEEDRRIRTKRIDFYKRNGAEVSDEYGWKLFDVDYNLLWLPIKTPMSKINIAEDIYTVYWKSLPHFFTIKNASYYRMGTQQQTEFKVFDCPVMIYTKPERETL